MAMGATAVLALTCKALPILKNRGPAQFGGRLVFITVHPSSLLRIPDSSDRRRSFDHFVADFKEAKQLAQVLRAKAQAKTKR